MCIHKLTNLPSLEGNYDTDNCSYEDLHNDIPCDSSDLSIIQFNIRGLTSKIGDLNYILNNSFSTKHPDVVLLCETWLSRRSPKPIIEGYNVERTDRDHKKGGGVAILISTRCRYRRRKDLEQFNSNSFESCFIELENWKSNLVIGSIYRPPNTEPERFIQSFKDVKETCTKQKNNLILGLDHNLDLLKANLHRPTLTFLETIYEQGMLPMITKPTRISTNTATLIDNILLDQRLADDSSSGIFVDNASDHFPCYALLSNINPSRRKQLEITSRDVRHKNLIALKEYLKLPGNLLPLNGTNVNEQFNNFHQKLEDAVNHFLPIKTRKVPTRSIRREKWMTAGLLYCTRRNKDLYKKMIQDRTNEVNSIKYKEYNNILQRTKRAAKRTYYYDQCVEHQGNTTKLWKTINHVIHRTNNKTEVVDKLKILNLEEHRGDLIAEEFARYFATIGKKYSTKMPSSKKTLTEYLSKIKANASSIFITPVTKIEVEKYIDNLKPKKSSGLDKIDNILIKELRDLISEPLSILYSKSLTDGIFPDKMKTAKVIPLHKSKDKDDTNNYRPISLLLTISKILEKAMYHRVYTFLCTTNQLYASQYGFRKNHACDQAVGELVSVITKGLEQKKMTAGIFLDLSKAFDSLEHRAVLRKMELYGLRGCCLDWFDSYLSDRKLIVSCRTADTGSEHTSQQYNVEFGTPQGSVLGPLIFLIFCNDLHLHLTFLSCIQFADDTTLYISHTNLQFITFALEYDLDVLQDWFHANKLTLNINKSVAILFGKHGGQQQQLAVRIGNETIPQLKSTKFLGLWIDENLNWREHTTKLVLKLNHNVNLLKTGKHHLTPHALKVVYYAQIHSNLTYGIGIWGSLIPKETLRKLQKIQNTCLGILGRDVSKHILTVDNQITLEMCKLWHKKNLGLLPISLNLTMSTDHHNASLAKKHTYSTRQKQLDNRPRSTQHQYHESFLVKGNREYSQLDKSLHDCKTVQKFTNLLKRNLTGLE